MRLSVKSTIWRCSPLLTLGSQREGSASARINNPDEQAAIVQGFKPSGSLLARGDK
jgi:hypothetical protein